MKLTETMQLVAIKRKIPKFFKIDLGFGKSDSSFETFLEKVRQVGK